MNRTESLVEALHEISGEDDLERIVDLVVLHAVDLLSADAGALFRRVNETTFSLWVAYGSDDGLVQALRAGVAQARLTDLAAADPRWPLFLPEGDLGELRLLPDSRSSVLVPIRTEDRLIAFLLIESRREDRFEADQKLLEVFALQAAVSINRVQLLRYREETQKGLLVSANAVAVGQIATSFIHG